jgi:hypothetical protein
MAFGFNNNKLKERSPFSYINTTTGMLPYIKQVPQDPELAAMCGCIKNDKEEFVQPTEEERKNE